MILAAGVKAHPPIEGLKRTVTMMKNREQWKPSKYVYRKGRLRASRDPKEVGVGSRLIADITARLYDEHIKDNAKGRLIDLGCGKVPLFEAYKDYVTDNVCVDWENTLHKNPYLDVECDLTKRLPFGDAEFDTVVLSDVLEHIPQPELVWHEIARIMRSGGRLLMNVPFYYWIHERPTTTTDTPSSRCNAVPSLPASRCFTSEPLEAPRRS